MTKFLLLLCCFAVTVKGKTQDNVKVIQVDPRQAYGGPVSDYFNNIQYIPLETTPESTFGEIANMVITDSSYIICDNDTKSILFFNPKGKFIKKISSNKDVFPYFEYDYFNKVVSICFISKTDFFSNDNDATKSIRFFRFSDTGHPIDTIVVHSREDEDIKKVNLGDGYWFKTQTCRFEKGKGPKDTTIYLMNIYKGDSLHKKLIPYHQKEQFGFCYFGGWLSSKQEDYTVIDGITYTATPYEHKVYKITKDTAIKVFEIVFPYDVAIPKSVLKYRDTKTLDSVSNIARPPGIIYSLAKIFFKGNKLFFKGESHFYLSTVSTSELRAYNFIYDTVQQKVSALERLTPDSTSSFLPVFDMRDGLMENGILYQNDYFYSNVSSLDMFQAYEKNKSRNPVYPEVLKAYFKTQNRRSNPVIVRMKLVD